MFFKQGIGMRPVVGSLFLASLLSSATNSYLAFFLIDVLGTSPWHISLFLTLSAIVSMAGNKIIGDRIDQGKGLSGYILFANFAATISFSLFIVSLYFFPALLLAILLLGISNTCTTTLYSLGRVFGDKINIEPTQVNTLLRMTTSVGWLFGPSVIYLLGFAAGPAFAFGVCLFLSVFALAFNVYFLPRVVRRNVADEQRVSAQDAVDDRMLLCFAAVCFLFSVSHVLCTVSMPLYLTAELLVPSYVPGTAIGVKCLFEIMAILVSARINRIFGMTISLNISGVVGLLAFISYLNATSIWLIFTSAALTGCFYGLFVATAITYIQSLAKGRIGRSTSLYMNSLFLGVVVATIAAGLLAEFLSFRSNIILAAVIIAMALLTLNALSRYSVMRNANG